MNKNEQHISRIIYGAVIISIFLFLFGCSIDNDFIEPDVIPEEIVMVFDTPTSSIENKSELNFDLTTKGTHILTILDTSTKSVITNESFIGIVGINSRKIYTTLLSNRELELQLMDSIGSILQKTIIILK